MVHGWLVDGQCRRFMVGDWLVGRCSIDGWLIIDGWTINFTHGSLMLHWRAARGSSSVAHGANARNEILHHQPEVLIDHSG